MTRDEVREVISKTGHSMTLAEIAKTMLLDQESAKELAAMLKQACDAGVLTRKHIMVNYSPRWAYGLPQWDGMPDPPKRRLGRPPKHASVNLSQPQPTCVPPAVTPVAPVRDSAPRNGGFRALLTTAGTLILELPHLPAYELSQEETGALMRLMVGRAG